MIEFHAWEDPTAKKYLLHKEHMYSVNSHTPIWKYLHVYFSEVLS